MHFSKTFASVAMLAMTAYAGFPVASVEFLSWEDCTVGEPALGQATFSEETVTTPVTCDKVTVNRDWNIDNYSFRAKLLSDDAMWCSGVSVWNNDDCSGEPVYMVPFEDGPCAEGVCLPDFLDPGWVSFTLNCAGFSPT